MTRSRNHKTRRGFTLVELLVVVLILAILMAVALPLYLGAIASSEKGAARANMQTIANANQSYKLRKGTFATAYTDLYGDTSDLGPATAQLKGPGNRSYDFETQACDHDGDPDTGVEGIPTGSFAVKSSVTTDGCFIPGKSTK
jgi:type IV pilus assembly protein PilA